MSIMEAERILMPPRTRVWQDGDWTLYFDPYNFIWVRVNASGRFLLERFQRYRTVGQVINEVVDEFGLTREVAERSVRSFVANLVAANFLHDGEYQERERPEFPKRDFAAAVYIHMTNNCNLRCPYCYNKSDREYKLQMQKKGIYRELLTTEEYRQLLHRLVELGVEHLFFTGGEPLMRSDTLELIEYARSLSSTVVIEVLTNAILIREDVAEKLCRFADMVTISLDGHERHLHEQYRGHNTFAPTIRGIKTLIETRRRLGKARPRVAIVPALTDQNIGFMKAIFEFSLDELGADDLAPILFQPGDHQELSIQQIPGFDKWLAARRETMEYFAQRQSRLEPESESAPSSIVPRHQCGVGNGEFSIDPAGYVYPCQTLHFDEFLCGNIRDEDILGIFRNSRVMRMTRGTEVDTLKVCKHCDLKYLCNGGCRATAYNVYRKFDAHNEVYCRHLKQMAVNRMWINSRQEASAAEGDCH